MTDQLVKTYTCSQAQITADKGESMKADIMQIGENHAEYLHTVRDNMRSDYWQLHNDIASHSFKIGTQTAAIAKLGQLAIALQAVETAYSAANSVRCW